MVGCLLHAVVCTIPDIQFTDSAVVTYMPFPTKELVNHAVHAFRYLAGTVDLALVFEVKGDPVCCVDADSRGDVDSQRSKTSFSFMFFYAVWNLCVVAE
jgi:hypothetical protein